MTASPASNFSRADEDHEDGCLDQGWHELTVDGFAVDEPIVVVQTIITTVADHEIAGAAQENR